MSNIYSTQKIMYHPELLAAMKRGEQPYPIQLHLMPDNRCNHNCVFCSYRVFGNKNTEMFDRKSYIPRDIMSRLLKDFHEMGGKAVELTGGGEPLLYPYRKEMFLDMIKYGFDIGLITNGARLSRELASLVGPHLTWARISIDSASKETYSELRKAPEGDFTKALKAVSYLRRYAQKPDFKLGVGFVVENGNETEVSYLCHLAKEAGADNVRVGAVFHPDGMDHFKKGVLERAKEEVNHAVVTLEDDSFRVYNRLPERIENMESGSQNYDFCGIKETLCVVGGDCSVFTCCSLAFNKKGLIGNLKDKGFKELWDSAEKQKLFSKFDPRKRCKYHCLYEKHNGFINEVLNGDVPHVNFI